jgi:hypothetical protein
LQDTLPPVAGLATVVIVYSFSVNVAVTPELAVILNVQIPVPEQTDAEPDPLLHPANIEVISGEPASVITVP